MIRAGQILYFNRAGDGIRTHGMVPWEGTALPLGDTR
jgi:hypothetical protein